MEFKTYTFAEAIRLLSGKGRVFVESRILFDDLTWLEVKKSYLLDTMREMNQEILIDIATDNNGDFLVSYSIE